MQPGASGIGHHARTDHHGIAGERFRLRFVDFDQTRNLGLQHLPAIVVEGAGVVDRGLAIDRAEAGIEVVIVRIDQLERQNASLDQLTDLLLRDRITPDVVSAEERFAAREGIPRAFEKVRRRQGHDREAMRLEPGPKHRFFALPLRMPEPREHDLLLKNHSGVGGEDEVREPPNRLHQFDFDPERSEQIVQFAPLLLRQIMVRLALAVHPWIDLVFDAVEFRRTHQDGGHDRFT